MSYTKRLNSRKVAVHCSSWCRTGSVTLRPSRRDDDVKLMADPTVSDGCWRSRAAVPTVTPTAAGDPWLFQQTATAAERPRHCRRPTMAAGVPRRSRQLLTTSERLLKGGRTMGESLIWQPAIYLANKFSLSLNVPTRVDHCASPLVDCTTVVCVHAADRFRWRFSDLPSTWSVTLSRRQQRNEAPDGWL